MNNGPKAVLVHIAGNYGGGIGGGVGNLSGLTPGRGTQIQHAMTRLCLEYSGHELRRFVLEINPTSATRSDNKLPPPLILHAPFTICEGNRPAPNLRNCSITSDDCP